MLRGLRDILKVLYRSSNRGVSGSFIARKVQTSVPSIRPRLNNLQKRGIIKPIKIGKLRTFSRTFGKKSIKIKSPSKILWGLDWKK